ncbi:hypothetical protein DFH09DRAFT_1080167 [Mycena vulgaris]|nr:hypothetical protein DFH09DRAFT_1080167 [Mycena vulgaris]
MCLGPGCVWVLDVWIPARAKTYFIVGTLKFAALVYVFFMYPGTVGHSLEEVEDFPWKQWETGLGYGIMPLQWHCRMQRQSQRQSAAISFAAHVELLPNDLLSFLLSIDVVRHPIESSSPAL